MFAFRVDLQPRLPPPAQFRSRVNFLYRCKFEWLDVGYRDLIAGLHCLQLAGIEMFKEMDITMELLGERVGRVTIREKF